MITYIASRAAITLDSVAVDTVLPGMGGGDDPDPYLDLLLQADSGFGAFW